MTRTSLICLAVLVLADTANAQPPGLQPSYKRPAVSPYLNLTRRGGSAAQNYYGLVRPEINAANAIQQLQSSQTALALQQQEMASSSAGPLTTGHVSGFLTHRPYFLNLGGASGRTGAAATPSAGKSAPARGRTR